MRLLRMSLARGGLIAFAILAAAPAMGQSLAPGRDVEPVVIDGSAFGDWVQSAEITTLNVYSYNGASFDAIPFQIDKKRKVYLDRNFEHPHGPGDPVCEYGYFRERFPETPDLFASNVLASHDEFVFMLKDAGGQQAPVTAWVAGAGDQRYEIILRDSRTGAFRYLYVFDWPQAPPDLNPTSYVDYTPDGTPPVCPPVAAACGTAEGGRRSFPGAPRTGSTSAATGSRTPTS